jgi:hypothetical protein
MVFGVKKIPQNRRGEVQPASSLSIVGWALARLCSVFQKRRADHDHGYMVPDTVPAHPTNRKSHYDLTLQYSSFGAFLRTE